MAMENPPGVDDFAVILPLKTHLYIYIWYFPIAMCEKAIG